MGPIYKSNVASGTPFDNSSNGFTSDNVQTAIEEAKASAISGNEQHSWNKIDTNKTILANRQMVVYQEVEILSTNELEVLGELVIID